MSRKIVRWLVGVRDGKILGLKKKIRNPEKNSRINQEMVNTIFLPEYWLWFVYEEKNVVFGIYVNLVYKFLDAQ